MVGFRYFTRKCAQGLGITGWVRNLSDGRVEAVVEGHRCQISQLLALLREGPPGARVTQIEEQEAPLMGRKDFSIMD